MSELARRLPKPCCLGFCAEGAELSWPELQYESMPKTKIMMMITVTIEIVEQQHYIHQKLY